MTYVRMADAAFAANIRPGYDIIGGYYGGPDAYHVWAPNDWNLFPGYRLPIWVAGQSGTSEGDAAVAALQALGVPQGSLTVVDMETRHDVSYVTAFGSVLHAAGYKTWVYGSASTVFAHPPLNGYWVADYTTDTEAIMNLMGAPSVRAVQYAADLAPGYDASWVKLWTEGEMWHG